jgi:hypothetical protein
MTQIYLFKLPYGPVLGNQCVPLFGLKNSQATIQTQQLEFLGHQTDVF